MIAAKSVQRYAPHIAVELPTKRSYRKCQPDRLLRYTALTDFHIRSKAGLRSPLRSPVGENPGGGGVSLVGAVMPVTRSSATPLPTRGQSETGTASLPISSRVGNREICEPQRVNPLEQGFSNSRDCAWISLALGEFQLFSACIGGDGAMLMTKWRRERDSNPRSPFRLSGFQDRLFQPLTHPSADCYTEG